MSLYTCTLPSISIYSGCIPNQFLWLWVRKISIQRSNPVASEPFWDKPFPFFGLSSK